MDFLIRYELASSSLEEERKEDTKTKELIQNLAWEEELTIGGGKGIIPSIEVR